ncbi:protein NUCLEAR FUSION DEFECTIVE 4-like [Olea europaea var. sylvestris]|uniref:NUCLEAR FUSION DEFECTIVE 4-like n=1 Tax=Olea europaea subsp. europaea TaxID=158383 RepID=A0A8S0TMN3_OLEEU|nr:protein NUCLEAR FUSION DEFECTIVE 4-like [Olea europaea var. sylvestris]CAA3007208.1 NUCLEAR FUSION DEFECTIVE 4-like [Olea europaea subsp. europaea]
MESSRWIAAVASIWIQCSCGASYAFGIYSPLLKSSQNYDQSTLDLISVFKDIGANAGILSGILYSATANSRRRQSNSCFYGPWAVHAAGAIQCFFGYFFIWLAIIGAIPRPEVPVMCLLMFLAAHAQTFFNTANVVTAVQNFPEYSGTIVGIMKGFLGLSGAVLIQVYQTLFQGKPSTFLLMLALLPPVLSIVLMWFVRVHQVPNREKNQKKYLNGISLISVVVAAYLMFLIILKNTVSFSPWAQALSLIVLLVLLSSPITIAVKAHKEDLLRSSQLQTFSSLNTPLMKGTDSFASEKSAVENPRDCANAPTYEHRMPHSEDILHVEELNLFQAMRTTNFWLLFVAMLCGMGSGLATINNISQIGESLGYTSVQRSTLVSLWSIWNFLGRFGAGYVSDILMHRQGWARPLLMTVSLATMAGGHIIIGSGFPGNLYLGSVLVGVCYGSQWSLMPTITSEIFGVPHMGTIFNTIAVASPVGSSILSVGVIGHIYDKEASSEGHSCRGTHCFMLSFFILASVTLFGFLVALVLFIKTRGLYRILILRRLQNSGRG